MPRTGARPLVVEGPPAYGPAVVNDVHSRLNATPVDATVRPESLGSIQAAVIQARERGAPVSIAGGRHAMGGQQFGTSTVLIDTRSFDRVLGFDAQAGIIEAEAGVHWPSLIEGYLSASPSGGPHWGIAQKQTGADALSLGGALSANAHGRGLAMSPIVSDVESFVLVDADGEALRCSRNENQDLFRLAIGGYGLFGVIASVTLRLVARRKLERRVERADISDLTDILERRVDEGFLYGDFQFAIDDRSPKFLQEGILSCYLPADPSRPIPSDQRALSITDWSKLVRLAHVNKSEAFRVYCDHYLATSGQVYWSDTHQLTTYTDDYHHQLDVDSGTRGSEMIGELFVPRAALADFMARAGRWLRREEADLVYGTVRLIERDHETFLAWARERYACVVFNLHTEHSAEGFAKTARAFRGLIDIARDLGGSYYLTYHRFARRDQIEGCHPRFTEFLEMKLRYDPEERFESDWYRHHRALFG